MRQLKWRNTSANCPLTAVVDASEAEVDEAKKLQMYEYIQQEVLDDGPFAILYYPLNQFVTADYVKDFVPMFSESYTEFSGIYKE